MKFWMVLAATATLFVASATQAATVSPTKPGPEFIPGSGIPADNFTIGIGAVGDQSALKARLRDTGQALAVSGNVYTVPAGSSVSNPLAPAWSFDYQFTPGLNVPANTNYTLTLQVDMDPSAATAFKTLTMPVLDGDALPTNSWDDGDGFFVNPGTWSTTPAQTPYVVANSWHLDMAFWPAVPGITPVYNRFTPGVYDIYLSVQDAQGVSLSATRIVANVVPEPATFGLLAFASLLAVGSYRRRTA